MNVNQNIFLNKKILIYGSGKTGISTFKFLSESWDLKFTSCSSPAMNHIFSLSRNLSFIAQKRLVLFFYCSKTQPDIPIKMLYAIIIQCWDHRCYNYRTNYYLLLLLSKNTENHQNQHKDL